MKDNKLQQYHYSIIIPYRDTLDLLHKAVASIPERADIQVIIVDNSVTPLTEEQIPKKQLTEVVYTTSDSTMGAGRARNEGLKQAQGQWLLFLDADDYFTDEAFAAFDKYLTSDYDIIYFDANSILLKDGTQSDRHDTIHQYIQEFIKTGNEDRLRYRFVNPISKMMKADFVLNGGFRFDETRVSNDVWFSVQTGHAAKKVTADASRVYMITAGEAGSSLTRKRTKENWFIRYQVSVRVNKFLKSVDKYQYHIRLLGFLNIALKEFGFKEYLHFLSYALNNRVGIF